MNASILDIPRAFTSPAHFTDPHTTYAACLRAKRYLPLPFGGHAVGVFGYEDARALLAQGAVQTPRLRTFFPVPDPELAAFKTLQRWIQQSILHVQGDDHRQLRALIERPFSAISIQRYEALIRDTIESHLSTLADRQEFDAVADVAAILPTQIMGRLLGLQPDEWQTARAAAKAIAHWMDSDHRSRRDTLLARNAVDALTVQLTHALERGSGLLLDALCARSIGTTTDITDMLGQCILFLVASQASLRDLMANAIHLTYAHSDVRLAMRDGQLSASAVVDETLRFEAPVQFLHRTVSEPYDGEFGALVAGTPVLICIGSAQRSAAFVADGHRFDPSRQQPASLSFGLTERSCVGRALARLSTAALLQALLERRPALVARGPVRWGHSFLFRGVAELKLTG